MENTVVQRGDLHVRKMHCPRCGSVHLTVQSNNRVVSSATTAHSVGKHMAIGVTSYDTENESFWFCQDCGMKFRDLGELKALEGKCLKKVKLCNTMSALSAVVSVLTFLLFVLTMDLGFVTIVPFLIFLGFTVAFFAFKGYWQKKAKEIRDEYNTLAAKVWQDA